jgi:expansin (peptidoglycan-binding protein)
MQVMNAAQPVTKLEVSTDGGRTWQGTTRQPYNFFEKSSGFGKDVVDVRVTGQNGRTVIVKNVGTTPNSRITASSNL